MSDSIIVLMLVLLFAFMIFMYLQNKKEIPKIEEESSFICDDNFQCVEVDGENTGPYTSKEHCESNCSRPATYSYFPQSLTYPYYRGHRGPIRRQRRRHHDAI